MELQRKRTYSMTDDDGYQNKPLSSAEYMNNVGKELENILYGEPSQVTHEDVIRNSLMKLGHDVTDIKCTLEKKKPKVTLVQLNEKLDAIIDILRRPHGD